MSINSALAAATQGALARKAGAPRPDCAYRNQQFRAFWYFGWDWMDDRLSDPRTKAELLDESTILAQMTTAVAEAKAGREKLAQMPLDQVVIWLIRLARGNRE